jgi:hypothetical protein
MTRAEERRDRAKIRVYHSIEAHDADDAAYWLSIPVAERVLLTWQLSEEQWRLRGADPNESRLSRSVASVRRP